MTDALHVVRGALRDVWQDLFTTAACNLMWLLCSLAVVTGPPATMALFYVGNRLAHGEPTDIGDFITGLRRYFWVGWRWGVINLALLFLLVGDILLTGRLSASPAGRLAQGLYLACLAAWLLLQLYTLPFLFEQETPGLRLALRNGAVMLGRNLAFSVWFGLLVALALSAGTLLFLISVAAGGVFVAAAANRAVLNRLAAFRAAENERA